MTTMLVIAIALFVFAPAMVGAIIGGMVAKQRPWFGFLMGGMVAALLGLALLSNFAR